MSQLPPLGPLTMDQFTDLLPTRELTTTNEEIEILFGRSVTSTTRSYRLPTVKDAMGVPAINGAVSLIAGTAGMLTVMGYRNGEEMAESPRLLSRPDPYSTPQAFYSGTAACMAKYGEFVWWIATRDGAGLPSSLQLVPLWELQVEDNPSNRVQPRYAWGTVIGSRYTPATPTGAFVHVKYVLAEPYALRGEGPLQMCKAAASVSVEAQAWAAQFYADGGNPSVVIKHAGELSPEEDEDGLNEAERLRAQWVNKPHNVPRVIDQNIESVEYKEVGVSGAQMLEAREHQNGDAARMFRIPGSLLEYQQSGASLTYQNLEGEFTKFVRTCLQPLYLEPIEQAMSDLLPRAVVARFNVDAFLRADIKTRFEVHGIAIDKGIYDQAYAQRVEGIAPGDVEFAPVPFAPPAAIPAAIPRTASTEVRDVRCPTCSRLVVRASGDVEGWCRHCKAEVWEEGPITLATPDMDQRFLAAIMALAAREQAPATQAPVTMTIEEGAFNITVHPAPAPNLALTLPGTEVHNEFTIEPAPVTVPPPVIEVTTNVEPTPVNIEVAAPQVDNHVTVEAAEPAQITIAPAAVTVISDPPRKTTKRVVRDRQNQITEIIEESTDG